MTKYLIEYFDKELSFHSLLLKNEMRIISIVIFIAIVLTVFISLIVSVMNESYAKYYVLGAILLSTILLLIAISLFTKSIKNNYPEIYISKFKWSQSKFEELVKLKLKDKLDDLGIKNCEQVRQISLLIKQKANNEKLPFIIMHSVIGALFLPLYYIFVTNIFNIYKSNILNLILIFFSALFLICIFSILILFLFKVQDDIITKYNRLNKLSEYLDDVELELLIRSKS